MTKDEIAAIDALAEKATKGPWTHSHGALYAPNEKGYGHNVCDADSWNAGLRNPDNAPFLAALVNSWPQLRDRALLADELAGALRSIVAVANSAEAYRNGISQSSPQINQARALLAKVKP